MFTSVKFTRGSPLQLATSSLLLPQSPTKNEWQRSRSSETTQWDAANVSVQWGRLYRVRLITRYREHYTMHPYRWYWLKWGVPEPCLIWNRDNGTDTRCLLHRILRIFVAYWMLQQSIIELPLTMLHSPEWPSCPAALRQLQQACIGLWFQLG